eukprot:SAG11_NODE_17928_length_505_cov_0.827586_1_plen_48_part_00
MKGLVVVGTRKQGRTVNATQLASGSIIGMLRMHRKLCMHCVCEAVLK